MTKISFEVKRSPFRFINRMMRAADLGVEGVGRDVVEIFTITWKAGAKVDVEKTKLNIKNALEQLGYDAYSVKRKRGE